MVGCAPGGDAPEAAIVAAKDSPEGDRQTILVVGTSLTAGLGLDAGDAYPAVLQRMIDSIGLGYRVINAGVSGETSAGALRRIDWVLAGEPPAVVIIETGANDGLRGQSVDSMRSNIEAIIDRVEQVQPRPVIMLAGMEALPNLGRVYGEAFRSVFREVAARRNVVYIPFFLDGIAGNAALNQADGVHPNEEGAEKAALNVWQVLEPLLR